MGWTALLMAASTGFSFIQSMQEQSDIEQNVKDQQKEMLRQQKEANLRAQEEKSERAKIADKQFASAIVAMETVGGAGSQNEASILAEIAGNKGLDLARIEGNRRREISSLQSSSNAARKEGKAAIKASQAQFLSTALGNAATYAGSKAQQGQAKDLVTPTGATTKNRVTIGEGAR